MADAMSNYLENEILDHILRDTGGAWTAPVAAALTVALFDTTASLANLEAGTLTGEVATGGYARQVVVFGNAASGVSSNSAEVSWTASGAAYGTVRYAAVMDATSAGNVLFYGQLAADKTIGDGDTFKFLTGDIDITMDSA